MRLQIGRIERLEKLASQNRYRMGLPPVFIVEEGPDTDAKIAARKKALIEEGYDPDLPLIILIYPDDEESESFYTPGECVGAPCLETN